MAASTNTKYRYCFFSHCNSTTIRTPKKYFFCLSKSKNPLWLHIANKESRSLHTQYYCCEDHYNVMYF